MATMKRRTAKARTMPAAPKQAKRDERIARAYARGKSRAAIAEQFGLSPHTVGRIIWQQGGRSLRS